MLFHLADYTLSTNKMLMLANTIMSARRFVLAREIRLKMYSFVSVPVHSKHRPVYNRKKTPPLLKFPSSDNNVFYTCIKIIKKYFHFEIITIGM